MKKAFLIIIASILLLASACAEEVAFPVLEWETDGKNHWQIDASGAVINQGFHATDDSWRCAICNSEITEWEEDIDVTDFDAYGNAVRYTNYSKDGEVNQQNVYVLTYNENGMIKKRQEYIDGVLVCEDVYTANAEGDQLPVSSTVWFDDGTVSVNQYDAYGNCIYAATYDVNGVVDCEIFSEFTQMEDEDFGIWYYECKNTTRFVSGEIFYSEANEYGDQTRSLNTYADGTAWSDYTYEYEYKNGVKVLTRTYSFGKLVGEDKYSDEGLLIEEIVHLEDGGKEVCVYNEKGDPVTATIYGADGQIVSVSVYEYVYTEQENILNHRVITNDRLVQDSVFQYEMDEDGYENFMGMVETFYWEDGTRSEKVYDSWMSILRETIYAEDGSIISEEKHDIEEAE